MNPVWITEISRFVFRDVNYLWLLSIIPILIIIRYVIKWRTEADMGFSSIDLIRRAGYKSRALSPHILFSLLLISICLLIVALARPSTETRKTYYKEHVRDIVLVLDVSDSMLFIDNYIPERGSMFFENPDNVNDRLRIAQNVIAEFIQNRPADRIGLITFKTYFIIMSPLTMDHDLVYSSVKNIKHRIHNEQGGTALGDAISLLLKMFYPDSDILEKYLLLGSDVAEEELDLDEIKKNQVAILLTDGKNTTGPEAERFLFAAKKLGVKIYTIGIGSDQIYKPQLYSERGEVIYRYAFGEGAPEYDYGVLKNIADETGGIAYRASNPEELKNIYEEIDKIEKSEAEVVHTNPEYDDFYYFLLFAAMGTIILYFLLKHTFMKTIP